MASSNRAKTKNKPSLKSQGAKYSTTNRKGVTTYYASSKDAPGYSDTRDGKNVPVSAGKPLSQVDANGDIINSEKLQPATPIMLPTEQPGKDYSSLTNGINASLASGSGGFATYDPTKGFASVPQTGDASADNLMNELNTRFSLYDEMESGEERLAKLEKQNKIKQKEERYSSLQNQINTITSTRDAEMLKLEGTGRGQTESFVGGEQARIGREAAIQALPLQAQLAAAQGDLESARSHVDRLYQVQTQDAENRYNFKREVYGTIFSYLNEQEKRRLALVEKEDDRAYDMQRTNLSLQNDWAKTAIEYGQSSLAGSIMALDPKSPNFQSSLAALQGRVSKPAPASSSTQDWALFNQSDGTTVQYNQRTGEVKPLNGAGGESTANPAQQKKNEALALAQELRLDTATGKNSAVGASLAKLVPDWVGKDRGLQPERAAFEAKLETLKSNLTLDNLKLLKGAMSDKDLAFLQAVGSSLDTKMSEKEFNLELDKVIEKLETAGAIDTPSAGQTKVYNGVTYVVRGGYWVPQ